MLTRRDALLGAARLAGGASLVGLAGCGDPAQVTGSRSTFAIDHATLAAPIEDLRHLVQREARRRRATVVFTMDPSGPAAQEASLRVLTGEGARFRAVVVAPFDAGALDDVLGDARARGVRLAGYLTPLEGESASIRVDAADAAAGLVREAERWARGNGTREVLLLRPPERLRRPDPFLALARDGADAVAGAAARLPVTAKVEVADAAAAERAVRARPGTDLVLAWDDVTARGAARALPASAWVGALGAPAVTTLDVLEELDGTGPLRCVVAPRLSDLAAALVGVGLRLARGDEGRTVTVPARVLARGAAATRAARADYGN